MKQTIIENQIFDGYNKVSVEVSSDEQCFINNTSNWINSVLEQYKLQNKTLTYDDLFGKITTFGLLGNENISIEKNIIKVGNGYCRTITLNCNYFKIKVVSFI